MDLDGLEKLVDTNHGAVMVLLNSIDKKMDAGDARFKDIDDKLLVHDRTITKVKTIGGIISAAYVLIAGIVAATFK